MELSVVWWCEYNNLAIPDNDSAVYQDFRRDAMYYLRSEIPNKQGLSVLQYATKWGLTLCVQMMLTEENVFLRKHILAKPIKEKKKLKQIQYELECTNLSPEYISTVEYSHGVGHIPKLLKEKEGTFMETLTVVDPPVNAAAILGNPPMYNIAADQWKFYHVFMVLALIIHLVIMIIYTYDAQNIVTENFNQSSCVAPENISYSTIDLIVCVYAFLLTSTTLFTLVGVLVKFEFLDAIKKSYYDFAEDRTYALQLPSFTVNLIMELAAHILTVGFAACVFTSIMYEHDLTTYIWVKGTAMLAGWLYTLIPARAFSPIYNFLVALKYIISKDMVPFLLFYGVISIAFGCALQLQFQLLSVENLSDCQDCTGYQDFYHSISHTTSELLVMTFGMDTDLKHVQKVKQVGRYIKC